MASDQTKTKAYIIKGIIDQITADTSFLQEREKTVKIILTEKQIKWFQTFIDAQLNMKTRPDIEIDALSILLPVVIKRLWPLLAAGGGAAIALILGKGKGDDN